MSSTNWRTDKYLALRRDAEYWSNSFLIKIQTLKRGLRRPFSNKTLDFKSDVIAFLATSATGLCRENGQTLSDSPIHKLDLDQVIISANYSHVKKGVIVFCTSLFVKRVVKRLLNTFMRTLAHVKRRGQFARDLTPDDRHVTYHRCVRSIRDQFKELVRRRHLTGLRINPIVYMVNNRPTLLPRVVLEWKTGFNGTPDKHRSPLVSLTLHPGITSVPSGEVRYRQGAFGKTLQMEGRLDIFPRSLNDKSWAYLVAASTARALVQAEILYSGRPAPGGLDRFLKYPALPSRCNSPRHSMRQTVQACRPERKKSDSPAHKTPDAIPPLDPSLNASNTGSANAPSPIGTGLVPDVEQELERSTTLTSTPPPSAHSLSPSSCPEDWPSLRSANQIPARQKTGFSLQSPSSGYSLSPTSEVSPFPPLAVTSSKISLIPSASPEQFRMTCTQPSSCDEVISTPCRRSERLRSRKSTLADFIGY